ncbi:MAG: GspH/FimT family pseudopilin [Ostreibacterium sp.]
MKGHKLNKSQGFTLLELIIVITIMGILATIAMPIYLKMLQRNDVQRVAKNFEVALSSAQKTAFVSGRRITVCPVNDIQQNASTSVCLTNWSTFTPTVTGNGLGWVVFRDANDNNSLDATETVYKKVPFTQRRVAMQWTGNRNRGTIVLSPRNTTGDSGTMRVFAPVNGATLATWNAANPPGLSQKMIESRIALSTLGRVTYTRN